MDIITIILLMLDAELAEVYGMTTKALNQAANAEKLLKLARQHWSIENRLHYVRDVSMGEDAYHCLA